MLLSISHRLCRFHVQNILFNSQTTLKKVFKQKRKNYLFMFTEMLLVFYKCVDDIHSRCEVILSLPLYIRSYT
jgi:hypothetical protein